MSKVLVSGGNGFVAVQVIIAAIAKGYEVVATVRSQDKADQTREVLAPRLGADISKLSFATVKVVEEDGAFDEVLKANQFVAVLHTATPFNLSAKDPKEITTPAVSGTKSILKSIKNNAPTVKRVIITSSFASIVDLTQGQRPGYVYSEKDWNPISWETTHDGSPVHAYYGAKTWAERAAWDFVKDESPSFELVTVCPPMVFGQVAQYMKSTKQLNTSSGALYSILSGQATEIPETSVPLFCNVADLATAHVNAIDAPDAGNKRFLTAGDTTYSNKEIADIFIKHYPQFAPKIPTKLPSGVDSDGRAENGTYTADNSLSKKILGMKYQSFEDTMVQFADSIKNLSTE